MSTAEKENYLSTTTDKGNKRYVILIITTLAIMRVWVADECCTDWISASRIEVALRHVSSCAGSTILSVTLDYGVYITGTTYFQCGG